MHILKNGNEKMQCCDSSEDRPSVIRHYPNPNRPCDFEGQPSVFEDEHCHSWQCADEQNWPDDWTMECLVCGYNRRDDFFSNYDDIAGCGERRIEVGEVGMESPFSSPFYDIAPGVTGGRLTPLPRMRVTSDGTFQISGIDLCQALDLYPNVLSVYEAYLIEKFQTIFDAYPNIRFVIEMEIRSQVSPNGVQNNGSESTDFTDQQQRRDDQLERLRKSKLIKSIREIKGRIFVNTGEEIELRGDPLDELRMAIQRIQEGLQPKRDS